MSNPRFFVPERPINPETGSVNPYNPQVGRMVRAEMK